MRIGRWWQKRIYDFFFISTYQMFAGQIYHQSCRKSIDNRRTMCKTQILYQRSRTTQMSSVAIVVTEETLASADKIRGRESSSPLIHFRLVCVISYFKVCRGHPHEEKAFYTARSVIVIALLILMHQETNILCRCDTIDDMSLNKLELIPS